METPADLVAQTAPVPTADGQCTSPPVGVVVPHYEQLLLVLVIAVHCIVY